jgi:hypothetical protein
MLTPTISLGQENPNDDTKHTAPMLGQFGSIYVQIWGGQRKNNRGIKTGCESIIGRGRGTATKGNTKGSQMGRFFII